MFRDREEAGQKLAECLTHYAPGAPVIFGLPRGGVVVAAAVARALSASLDIVVARKIGHPDSPEYAVGAISEDGQVVLNPAETVLLSQEWLEHEKHSQLQEAQRRRRQYAGQRPPASVEGKTAILVDDGIATGYTLEAAIMSMRVRRPARLVIAVPVAPPGAAAKFAPLVDELVTCETPSKFFAIGQFYVDFTQTTDDQVTALLAQAYPQNP